MAGREKKVFSSKKAASPAPVLKDTTPSGTAAEASSKLPSAGANATSSGDDGAPPKLTMFKPVPVATTKVTGQVRNSPSSKPATLKVISVKKMKKGGATAMGKNKSSALSINLKAKSVKKSIKIKKLAKAGLLSSVTTKGGGQNKAGETTTLVNNGGMKSKRIRKTKAQIKAEREQTLKENDAPPVLEPMLPLIVPETAVDGKKVVKKKMILKKMVPAVTVMTTAPPTLTMSENERLQSIDQTIDSVINSTAVKETIAVANKTNKKKGNNKTSLKQQQAESMDDIVKDLTELIQENDIIEKKEQEVICNDEEKTEILKPTNNNKKLTVVTRSAKSDLLNKNKTQKIKEYIENNLGNNIIIDMAAQRLINVLDLSVPHKFNQRYSSSPLLQTLPTRRHTIEKFPIPSTAKLGNLPRTITTPKTKCVVSRTRKSLDMLYSKRFSSPYTTRSDSHSLRNGKSRRRAEALFDGLDVTTVRRRNRSVYSDFSGSEKSISRCGYESDCSVSDKLSSCGRDSADLQKDGPIKTEALDTITSAATTQNQTTDAQQDNNLAVVKSSLTGMLVSDRLIKEDFTDGNSNNLDNVKMESDKDCAASNNLLVLKNSKVPDKCIILDIMKQTFNDVNTATEDREKRTTRSSLRKTIKVEEEQIKTEPTVVSTSKFYGGSSAAVTVSDSPQKLEATEEENTTSVSVTTDLKTLNGAANLDVMQSSQSDNTKIETLKDIKVMNGDIEVPMTDANVDEDQDVSKVPMSPFTEQKKEIIRALGLVTLPEAKMLEKSYREAKEQNSLARASEISEENKKGAVKGDKNDYTGTLKTVIRKKGGRNSLKWTLGKNKYNKTASKAKAELDGPNEQPKSKKDGHSSSWRSHGSVPSSDTAGALRKSHYSNRSNNLDGSSEEGETGEDADNKIIIPEKASSYGVHPDKLCADECEHCKTKFGVFDTPQHIALLKNVERQNKILQNEPKLTLESCLCDACYRHVDRKANAPSYSNKGFKKISVITPRQNFCHVLGCNNPSSNILRRKWIIKMRKSICQVINIDLANPGLHSIPICNEHYSTLQHLMVCSLCKIKLQKNHISYVGSETDDLNEALRAEGIPVELNSKNAICKCCKMFTAVITKPFEDRHKNDVSFYNQYKRRLKHYHGIELMDDAEAEEPIPFPAKEKPEIEQPPSKRRKKLSKSSDNALCSDMHTDNSADKNSNCATNNSETNSTTGKSRSESPSDGMIDYNMLTPSIAMECSDDNEGGAMFVKKNAMNVLNQQRFTKRNISSKKSETITTASGSSLSGALDSIIDNNNAVQRLGSNPSISVRQLFPGEEEMGLQANIDFGHVKEKTPEGWEKCTTTIQYDPETKTLWNELQKPYGSQSSFLRHLLLLEKYYRSGDLVLSQNASHNSINYSESVQNRLRSFDNVPTMSSQVSIFKRNLNSVAITKLQQPHQKKSLINAATIPKNTPITISQINHMASSVVKTKKSTGAPPDLISLQAGTSRGVKAISTAAPLSQKIRIPLTNHWRPNLIPADDPKEKRPGFVTVKSNGATYFISFDDYNRMSALKKSYDLKVKRAIQSATTTQSVPSQQQDNDISQQRQAGITYLKRLAPRKSITILKNKTVTSDEPKNSDTSDMENSLERLDKTVENLESKLLSSDTASSTPVSLMNLPKIPKSLTVIPQTVSTSRASQPPNTTTSAVSSKGKLTPSTSNNINNGKS